MASDFVLREITAVLARKIEREREVEKRGREKKERNEALRRPEYTCVVCFAVRLSRSWTLPGDNEKKKRL